MSARDVQREGYIAENSRVSMVNQDSECRISWRGTEAAVAASVVESDGAAAAAHDGLSGCAAVAAQGPGDRASQAGAGPRHALPAPGSFSSRARSTSPISPAAPRGLHTRAAPLEPFRDPAMLRIAAALARRDTAFAQLPNDVQARMMRIFAAGDAPRASQRERRDAWAALCSFWASAKTGS